VDVLQHLERCRRELDQNLHAEEREEELVQQTRKAVEVYRNLAGEIRAARVSAREDFARKVERELKQVAMEKCRFRVNLAGDVPLEDGDTMMQVFPVRGWESVQFEIEPNPGEGFRDLNRIASGGELSRMMLALKVVTQVKGESRSLIFDEIDAGIGGRAADQIGERLQRLSRHVQVLCVTHLPQVAAYGDHHFQVRKRTRDNRTITIVEELRDQDRIRELARMISGSEVTDTALRHAKELREAVEARTP
jgi:DNA repair protein RecN (Recombination protein N)